MSKRSQIARAVQKARYSMMVEYFLKNSQRMIAYILLLAFIIMFVSRFFVLPFYQEMTIGIAAITFCMAAFYLWWKRPTKKQTLNVLDDYFPDNLLRTVYSMEDLNSPLAQQLIIQTEKIAADAVVEYNKRKKNLWRTKSITASIALILGISLLSLFPSSSQQYANTVKEEKRITADMKKTVKDMEKRAETKETKKSMEELRKELKKSKTTEEALQALVKKQKELAIQKQKLEDKEASTEKGLSKEEQQQLQDLTKTVASLSKEAVQTQKALNQSGTSISPNLQLALNQSMQSDPTATENSNQTSQTNTNSTANNNQNATQNHSSSSSQSNNQSSANGQKQGNNQNNGNGSGNQNGNGNSNSNSNGNSDGNGGSNGSGNSSNLGNGTKKSLGSGAGLGNGNRDLVAIPNRIGEKGKTTTDSGELSDGDPQSIQQSDNGKVAKGSVRSYKEVIGNYKDSYMQTTERLQLPGELHQIVQKYFSSVEK